MLTNVDTFETPLETDEPILQFRRPDETASSPLAFFSTAQRFYLPLRRVLDFTLALLLSAIALPIVLLAAFAVRLTSRGPAFYTQMRTGKNGRTFTIYKLRSMIDKCESLTGPRWTIPGDPRVTPIGWLLRRTHIDELPQLFNVLKGEMSLVGPRPERPEFVRELANALPGYADRHAVLPGITGLAQVQLAPDTDLESVRRKLVYDLHFIRRLSLWLDLRILLATGLHMLGVSFARLRKLGVVPTPAPVETNEFAAMKDEPSHRARQAA
jgi:lipopolysaccharide/colanic/teichoic acid biosynthesis glycosyltransferase